MAFLRGELHELIRVKENTASVTRCMGRLLRTRAPKRTEKAFFGSTDRNNSFSVHLSEIAGWGQIRR